MYVFLPRNPHRRLFRQESGNLVEDECIRDGLLFHEIADFSIVIAQVDHVNLLEMQGGKGRKGMGIGILDDKEPPALGRRAVHDFCQAVVAVKEDAVFVLGF